MMAKSKESFDRRQRERAKKAKADAKRERRLTKPEASDAEEEEVTAPAADEDALLAELAQLHAAYDDEQFGAPGVEVLSLIHI